LPRPDWSRPLPRPIVIPKVMTLKTLADVRALIERHLPAERRERPTWRYVAQQLARLHVVATQPRSRSRCA
jgi:fructosamine-3-kinase